VNWLGPTALFDTQTSDCVGCHSFTRSGDLLAYSTFTAEFGTYSVNSGQLSSQLAQGRPQSAEWSALHPDGQFIATIDSNHQLNLHDAITGNLILNVSTSSIAPLITQPFWSPLGDKIVFVASSTTGTEGPISVEEGSIWTMDFSTTGGSPRFSNPTLVVGPLASGGNAYYPSFSPDGLWIAFCRAASAESYNNPDSQLWLVKSDLSAPAISLDRANLGPGLYNSWPRWAPTVNQGQYWIVFSSQRPYRLYVQGGPQQLWVSRIDTNLSGDPSNPALWLEGQNPFAGNLTAEWSINQ
jgi:Tol biopolymer transport system component